MLVAVCGEIPVCENDRVENVSGEVDGTVAVFIIVLPLDWLVSVCWEKDVDAPVSCKISELDDECTEDVIDEICVEVAVFSVDIVDMVAGDVRSVARFVTL
ncbi:unnamed protein product, partial [Rotaria sp. Silwood1]